MELSIETNCFFSKMTTFKIGGRAKYYVEVINKHQLKEAVKYAKDNRLRIFVLGDGSDILVSDKGFPGLVIKCKNTNISFKYKKNYVLVNAEAGLNWDDLVRICVKKELQGIECLSGIPGSVGAAPVQNIGAYGQELKDSFIRLIAFDINNNKFITLEKKCCGFGYRESIFNSKRGRGKYIIYKITLKLHKGFKPNISYDSLKLYLEKNKIINPSLINVRNAIISLRKIKLEDTKLVANAGSFFKNPIVNKNYLKRITNKYKEIPYIQQDKNRIKLYAGWLIEKAGWKGKSYKGAAVSKKNSLILINKSGKAKASEISILANMIITDIKNKFAIILEPEVQYIGFK